EGVADRPEELVPRAEEDDRLLPAVERQVAGHHRLLCHDSSDLTLREVVKLIGRGVVDLPVCIHPDHATSHTHPTDINPVHDPPAAGLLVLHVDVPEPHGQPELVGLAAGASTLAGFVVPVLLAVADRVDRALSLRVVVAADAAVAGPAGPIVLGL